jgi:hypothetical protein
MKQNIFLLKRKSLEAPHSLAPGWSESFDLIWFVIWFDLQFDLICNLRCSFLMWFKIVAFNYGIFEWWKTNGNSKIGKRLIKSSKVLKKSS